jgi:hypothetical protein
LEILPQKSGVTPGRRQARQKQVRLTTTSCGQAFLSLDTEADREDERMNEDA